MSRIVIDEGRCKGCLLCTTACPVNIIRQSQVMNALGYKIVEVDPERRDDCTGCTACAQMCPDAALVVFRTRKGKEEAE